MRDASVIGRRQNFLTSLGFAVVSLVALKIAQAEVAPWRMNDGRVLNLELRDAWGEDEAAMVEFISPEMKLLTLKRNEIHPEDQKKIPTDRPRSEDLKFVWARARHDGERKDDVTIIYNFERSLPGVTECNEGTLKVAPFKIGDAVVAPEAWKVITHSGPDGAVVEFRTTGPYDATKLAGAKFSASVELEVGKDRRRSIQRIDFPQRPLQEVKVRFGEMEITSV
ncbi:hypothetical protein [Luteolibacter soli]|uniref:Uncharacterized protein n=1 Tax=Luteolibacter soli TaxID=3135280 RepID=A0ABU9AR42_9BACT